MKNYFIQTNCYMKDYNDDKYFIMTDTVKDKMYIAKNTDELIKQYTETLENEYGISISKNAIRNKDFLYDVNDKIIGYVFTGKTEFPDRDRLIYVKQYIDVYTKIYTIIDTEF